MLVIFLLSLAFLLLLSSIFFSALFISSAWSVMVKNEAPFVPLGKEALEAVVEHLGLGERSVFFDLGCGDGRILLAVAKKYPGAEFIGVERSLLPFLLAKTRTFFWGRGRNIKVVRKNIFEIDPSSATHIFCYLFPEQTKKLLPRLQQNLRPGTKVIVCDFCFSEKDPDQVIDLSALAAPWSLKHKLYIYNF